MSTSHSADRSNQAEDNDETVGELRALIDRIQKALREVGEEYYASVAHIEVWPDRIGMAFRPSVTDGPEDSPAHKAISFDPRWEIPPTIEDLMTDG